MTETFISLQLPVIERSTVPHTGSSEKDQIVKLYVSAKFYDFHTIINCTKDKVGTAPTTILSKEFRNLINRELGTD